MKVCHGDNFTVLFIVGSKELYLNIIANHFPVGIMREKGLKLGC